VLILCLTSFKGNKSKLKMINYFKNNRSLTQSLISQELKVKAPSLQNLSHSKKNKRIRLLNQCTLNNLLEARQQRFKKKKRCQFILNNKHNNKQINLNKVSLEVYLENQNLPLKMWLKKKWKIMMIRLAIRWKIIAHLVLLEHLIVKTWELVKEMTLKC